MPSNAVPNNKLPYAFSTNGSHRIHLNPLEAQSIGYIAMGGQLQVISDIFPTETFSSTNSVLTKSSNNQSHPL